ncbi:peptidoglycan DD-metalloendopeptidase family protein [Flavobacteriaceae bacterium S356]|uniref:Peptidoglycan DD-metalloendopeptidase family protein n=1 Tax=Asprobacillus argus TaxID=3076534 RepID=A0ABU3LDA4_9FLAO|nr:peptidoglycan DD-metalloendopeptidase family protein [Flavobacteriaceae bacterium S356]
MKLPPGTVLDAPAKDYVSIDISSSNKTLDTFDVSSSKEWEKYINSYVKDHQAKIAYGGYLEVRDIYNRSSHFNNTMDEERNIHLGIDLWTASGTAVLAPLEGTVHSFQNNTNYGDYGPTIILEHSIGKITFYTLYGHLSENSIATLQKGKQIQKGAIIGYLGDATVNGDYAPHLHFQIILDIADYKGDYPGVTSKKELNFYQGNCPDPNLLLKLS